MSEVKKVVLAYSGGLDTSIIIPWLKEHYNNCEVIAVCGNVGQKGELEGLEERAKASGASKLYILSQRLLILAIAPLQAAFPSLILLVVSFERLRKRELHAMKPYTAIISQPLVAPKYLYSLHQQ